MKLKDKKIRILAYESYTNNNGFPVEKWNVIHEGKLWAYYRQLSGKEFFAAATVNAEENVLFTVNYRTDIEADMIVEYAGEYYQITRIDDHEGYKTDIDLYCKTNPEQHPDITEE
mgnify:FL=1